MAVLTYIETDTGTNVDISAATAVGAYTSTGDKLVMCDISIDAVAGNGDYVMYVTRQIGGSGSAYVLLPKTTMTAASGETAISGQSGWITVRNGDVLTVYVDGLAGDTSTPDWSTRWFEDAGVLPAVPTDWLTADGVKADAVTKIQSGLATATALATAQADLDNPSQYKADVSGLMTAAAYTAPDNAGIAAIESKTNNLPTSPAPANEYDARMTAIQADLDNPDQYKADVSALATSAALDAVDNFIDTEITTIDGIVDAIKLKTDLIPATPAQAGEYTAAIDAVDAKVSAIDTDTVMSFMIDGFTFEQIVQIMASVLAGKLTRSGDTLTFRDLADTVNRVVAETDANKQRTTMTYTV